MENNVYLCVGGDSRQIYMCEELSNYGKVYSIGIPVLSGNVISINSPKCMEEKADVLVLPIMKDNSLSVQLSDKNISFEEITPYLKKGGKIFGGMLKTPQIEYFSSLGFNISDFLNREELVAKNCIPTAEGALQIAMQELGITIYSCKVLVIGYGRVGKLTAKLFKNVGGEVSVCARRKQSLVWARVDGMGAFDFTQLGENIGSFDLIINTVPALVLTGEILDRLNKNALVIDLASKPGGVDFKYASQHNKRVVWALGLPGKVAPITAGKIIGETIGELTEK